MTIWFSGSEEYFEGVGGPHFYTLWRGLKKHFNALRFGEMPQFDLLHEVDLLKANVVQRVQYLSRIRIDHQLTSLIVILDDISSNLKKLFNQKDPDSFISQKDEIEKKIIHFRILVEVDGKDLREKLIYAPGSRRRLLKGAAVTAGVAAGAGAVKLLKSLRPSSTQEPETLFGQSFFRQLPKTGDIKFKDLKSLEEGKDYEIRIREGEYPLLIFAPHGGLIEPGTELLASNLAGNPRFGASQYIYYAFIARTQVCDKNGKCKSLHITSTKFREPRLLALMDKVNVAISIHTFGSLAKGEHGEEEYRIIVGGLNKQLRDLIIQYLDWEHFPVEMGEGKRFSGRHPKNITNFPPLKGVQIEISRAEMRNLFYLRRYRDGTEGLEPQYVHFKFIGAVRRAIREYHALHIAQK
ncbi:poly-gamma-glutamate hydrolase family protein [Candidatus Woesearchaeota archaeon]|nr:poly-gamma-glutamate hydrolase family protein [Candidatus Woesearchaeota archaeon]